jgi:hypothetical protein
MTQIARAIRLAPPILLLTVLFDIGSETMQFPVIIINFIQSPINKCVKKSFSFINATGILSDNNIHFGSPLNISQFSELDRY